MQQSAPQQTAATPNITQVNPQTIPAGSQSMTLKVTGTNFPNQAAILWNGAALTTTVVDANTLSGTIGSSSLSTPGTAKLQVQNTQTMQESQPVSVTIADASPGSPSALIISLTPLPQGVVNAFYTGTLAVTGGTSPYHWSVTTGQLPPGLILAATSGVISGTPTSNGNYSFGVTVADSSSPAQSATATVALTVGAAPFTQTPLTINSTSLPSGTIGAAYSTLLQASGGTAPYSWSITAGSLPAGLNLAPTTGIISGTATSSGTTNFTATVADVGNPAQTKSVALSLVIAPIALTITSSALPSGTQGIGYSRTLQASGGTAPYTWSISSGALPTGLTLSATTGLISGTPTVSGNFTFGATVKDAGSPSQTTAATVTLTLVAAGAPLAISSTTLPGGTPNQAYNAALNATGGTGPYSWSLTGGIPTGTLPAGLTLAANTGVISGTPTASSTASLIFKVVDSSSPVQTKSVTLSLVVAPVPLAITTSSLPSGTKGTTYSNLLQASGGTTSYNWSVTVGSLPAGLTLAANTGLITGTPTASGTVNFTATVTDTGSPTQSKSVPLSIVVAAPAAPALTISATLVPGAANTAYSSPMTATGGTPAYTWAITAGSLPSGLSLAATTGIISGTPTTTGTYNFTATVNDNGTPVQTKSAATSITVAGATGPSGPGTTWYVRPDGGTRYSATMPTGQCDGKADTAYSGTGTNQHCAFGDYRYLWDDQSYGSAAWVIAGGDTVILRGGPWRVGFSANDGSDVWCYGGSGPYNCTNPTIPAGTATQHTQILGENYASCGSQASETQLFGGFGVQITLNLKGAQFVDVKCIELTRHSQCIQHGQPVLPSGCNTSYPGTDDYSSDGIFTDVHTHDLLLQDMWIHGFTDRGVIGPIGGLVTATRVDIAYNGMAGWDFDDGSGSNNGNGTASVNGIWNLNQTKIEWNGCNQEYPIVHQFPATSCYSQSTGGYGDGVGTPPGTCLASTIIGSSFNNNTQDGIDLGHADTGTNCPLTIIGSTAYGNNGGTFKLGPNENPAVFENNVAIGNCLRMSQPIPGTPSTYNANLTDFCRSGDNLPIDFRQGGTALIANNTFITYAPTTIDTQCWDAPGAGSPGDTGAGCANSSLTFENNIVIGYDNPTTYNEGGQQGGPGMFYSRDPIGTIVRKNNLYYGIGHGFTCPTGFAGEICQDPLFVNQPTGNGTSFVESELDNFNSNITLGSPAVGAGISIPSLLLDYSGVQRPNPPSIGVLEPH
jgi:Putative Ig domain